MILMPEVALISAAIALLLTLVNCLMIFSANRRMSKQMTEIRIELDANLSANHGLARHVRELQRGVPASSTASHGGAEQVSEREIPVEEPAETDTMSLAEKLGLSKSEAEIITHLRPRRGLTSRVRETA